MGVSSVITDDAANNLQICDIVTAVCNENNKPSLLGICRATYTASITSNKAVLNGHMLHEDGWTIDKKAERHQGKHILK